MSLSVDFSRIHLTTTVGQLLTFYTKYFYVEIFSCFSGYFLGEIMQQTYLVMCACVSVYECGCMNTPVCM